MHLLLAYIDPGSGSLLIQAIVAALLAVPFFFRRTIGDAWHRITGGSRGGSGKGSSTADAKTDSDAGGSETSDH